MGEYTDQSTNRQWSEDVSPLCDVREYGMSDHDELTVDQALDQLRQHHADTDSEDEFHWDAALTLRRAQNEISRLRGALTACRDELLHQRESTYRCGDPEYECPLQDCFKTDDPHYKALQAAEKALTGDSHE